ncbi:MAG: hypothetical protein RLZZ210_1606 [Pseudomonadota bacterium]|jgi:5-methylcytosine-specific restriction protein A
MNRKHFIELQGATCRNWRWSWSFINKEEKVIIFGAWDTNTNNQGALILEPNWNKKGCHGYNQSREHIRLIEEEGYKLKIFKIFYSDSGKGNNNSDSPKIKKFTPELKEKILKKINDGWYAVDSNM